MTGFLIGLVLGAFVGICVMALLQINFADKRKEDNLERKYKWDENHSHTDRE